MTTVCTKKPKRSRKRRLSKAKQDELIVQFAYLPRHVVNRMTLRNPYVALMETDDAVSEGRIGLVKAARHFDPGRGIRFMTYAYRCIATTVHKAANMAYRRRMTTLSAMRPDWSIKLDSELDNDCWEDHDPPRPTVLPLEDREVLDMAMDLLTPREERIIKRHFLQDETFADIGRTMGVSRERVRSIAAVAIARVREKLPHLVVRAG